MKGHINIGRWQANFEPREGVRIEIVDEDSRIHFLEINMTVEDFARAVMGLSEQDCTFELRGVDRVGKRRENKQVLVDVSADVVMRRDAKAAAEVLAAHEVDGWIAPEPEALFNWHRVVHRDHANNSYKVQANFIRYVEAA